MENSDAGQAGFYVPCTMRAGCHLAIFLAATEPLLANSLPGEEAMKALGLECYFRSFRIFVKHAFNLNSLASTLYMCTYVRY